MIQKKKTPLLRHTKNTYLNSSSLSASMRYTTQIRKDWRELYHVNIPYEELILRLPNVEYNNIVDLSAI